MKSPRIVGIVACLATFASITPAASQSVCNEATNLTVNCDFAAGISDWTQGMGYDFIGVGDGHLGRGSLEAVSSFMMVSENISFYQCIESALFPPAVYGAGFWVKVVSGAPESCSVVVIRYEDPGCLGDQAQFYWTTTELDSSWRLVNVQFQGSATHQSVKLDVSCRGSADFTARFDEVYLGADIDPSFFADGFESGDTLLWSTSLP